MTGGATGSAGTGDASATTGTAGTAGIPDAPVTRTRWARYVRLIASAFPPIDLFEDIADPADWDLLELATERTNARSAETVGKLDLVPPARRVGGPGASYVMAPFVHVSPDHPGRFHDGTFGAFYAADTLETAVAEKAFHAARFAAATRQAPGWLADWRELVGTLDADLVDLRGDGFGALLHPDPERYGAAQAFARTVRAAGHAGILYPSVRQPGGACFAAFWPDVPAVPVVGRHFTYHWDGARVDLIREATPAGPGQTYRLVE